MRYLQRGITIDDRSRAFAGFTIFSPQYQKTVYLVNMAGEVVHRWELPDQSGNYAYLLENGNLLASSWAGGGPDGHAARGGLIQEIDWDGKVVWEYRDPYQHHDFRRLPNGNTIYLGWELMRPENVARLKGGRPGTEHKEGIWADYVREVNRAGETVWEWHGQDHMVIEDYPLPPTVNRHEATHPNAIMPLVNGDAMICFRQLDVVAVIDRKTGGFAWKRHEPDWGGPHDFQVLPNGNYMVFANRQSLAPRGSKIVEFDPKTNDTVWEYQGNPSHSFDSHFISGCQRLANGNTLICEGLWGRIFEVTKEGDIVWEYISPFTVNRKAGSTTGDQSTIFRAYRYAPDSPQIRGRLDGKLG
jgi:hypothetical protein